MKRDDGTTISNEALVDWKNFYRDLAALYFENNPIVVGGPGSIVEIDETVITRRKYNRGRLQAEDQWYFGGFERGSGLAFIVPVEKRDAATLLPIIQKHIRPGTTIISDLWRAYCRISQLPEGYRHYTVNHSENFVDPESGACTNSIESTWQKFKSRHKKEYGTARNLLGSYLGQFLWQNKFGGEDAMFNLWSQIVENYSKNSTPKKAL